MRNERRFLFALSAVFALPAHPEVIQYQVLGACPGSAAEDCMIYFDPDGVHLSQGILTANLIQNYYRPQSIDFNGNQQDYNSADVYMTFDCANKRYKTVETIYRAGSYSRGKIVGSIRTAGTGDGEWKPFPTESGGIVAAVLRAVRGACDNAPVHGKKPAASQGYFSW